MPRTVYITIFGLNTPADSDCYGLRPFMQSLAGPNDSAFFFAFDNPDLLADIYDAVAGFSRIILCGHSHGGAAVKWILDRWSSDANSKADLAIFLDPAPEVPHFGQFFAWQAADADLHNRWHIPFTVCPRAICLYQRNEIILPGLIGVCGVPFVPVPLLADTVCQQNQTPAPFTAQVQNYNITQWGLYHCHMLADPRVQSLIRQAVHPS